MEYLEIFQGCGWQWWTRYRRTVSLSFAPHPSPRETSLCSPHRSLILDQICLPLNRQWGSAGVNMGVRWTECHHGVSNSSPLSPDIQPGLDRMGTWAVTKESSGSFIFPYSRPAVFCNQFFWGLNLLRKTLDGATAGQQPVIRISNKIIEPVASLSYKGHSFLPTETNGVFMETIYMEMACSIIFSTLGVVYTIVCIKTKITEIFMKLFGGETF